MFASLLQLAGIGAAVAGLVILAGLGGFLLGGGAALVYVGLAFEGRGS